MSNTNTKPDLVSTLFKQRTVRKPDANSNPFSIAKIQHALEQACDHKLYQNLKERTTTPTKDSTDKITNAVNSLKARIKTSYTSANFGYIEQVQFELLDINIDNQRDVDWDHVAHIIETFDPRAVQVVNTIKLRSGRYSVPEGQHTAVALYILHSKGLLPADFTIACKVIEEIDSVPGSELKGEAFGNYLFRVINYKGRKSVAPYFMHKSRVSGVRNYGSKLLEDIHAEEIETVVERNNMFTRPAIDARGQGAAPGMITYITGLNIIGELESENFNVSIGDLDNALRLHNTHFANEKGVDGGFILGLGRYYKLARKSDATISKDWENALMRFFKQTYASPDKYHKACKSRLTAFQKREQLHKSWSDKCLLSILILDFYKWCDENNENYNLLPDLNLNSFKGI